MLTGLLAAFVVVAALNPIFNTQGEHPIFKAMVRSGEYQRADRLPPTRPPLSEQLKSIQLTPETATLEQWPQSL